jgi:glutathione S-transferase
LTIEKLVPMSIEPYTLDTPNGRKISVAREEIGLTYMVHPVDIFTGEQFDPAFLKISLNPTDDPTFIQEDRTWRLAISGHFPARRH